MHLSDLDYVIGAINGLMAVAERLTGDRLEIRLTDSQGNFMWISGDRAAARWVEGEERAPVSDLEKGEVNLSEWNRKLVSETLEVLEQSRDQTAEAISRLRGCLAVNPGGEVIPAADEESTAYQRVNYQVN